MWFMNEKLKMCLVSKGLGSTHIRGLEVFRPISGFHMHCLKSFLKACPQSKIKHPQAVHNILWQATFKCK